jgi:hypothetical protein
MAIETVGQLERWNEAAWLRLPSSAPGRLAQICADGLHLSAWPAVGALILPLAALAGFLLGAFHLGYEPPDRILYLYSLGTMILLLAISQNGAACGVAAWTGFALGDLLHSLQALGQSGSLLMLVPTRFLACAILAIPLISTPICARAFTQSVLSRVPAQADASVTLLRTVGVQGVATFGLIFMWTQVAPILLQPVYVWQGLQPLTHGLVQNMQQYGWILALVAGYAAAVRGVLELAAATPALVRSRAAIRQAQALRKQGGLIAQTMTVIASASFLTLVSSSLLTSWGQATVLFIISVAVLGLRGPLLGRLNPSRWLLPGLPMAGRFLLGVGVMTVVATALGTSSWGQTNGFGASVASTEIGLVVFAVLMTPLSVDRRGAEG